MDFFPSIGEPGILDDLFWYGPLVFQLILLSVFYRLTGKRAIKDSKVARILTTFGLVVISDILLFIAFGLVFKIANPTL